MRYFERRGDDLVERLGADSPTAEVQSAEGRALPTVGDVNYDGVLDLLVDTQTAWSLVQGVVLSLVVDILGAVEMRSDQHGLSP